MEKNFTIPKHEKIIHYYDIISKASMEFCNQENLITIPLPATSGAVTSPMGLGSDSTPVKIKKLNDNIETYLNDSSQFLLEYVVRNIKEKGAFSITPSYRGEMPDKTHLSMFYHAETEIKGNFYDAMSLAEKYVKYIVSKFMDYVKDKERTKKIISQKEFPRIHIKHACELVGPKGIKIHKGKNKREYFKTINREGEKYLIKKYRSPVWLTNLYHLGAPFYQAFQKNEFPYKFSLAADLLMGPGEVIGLGQRHSTKEDLMKSFEIHKLNPKIYQSYIDMRKFSPITTSGFGVGLERLLMTIFKKDNIQEFSIFSRDNGSIPYI